MAQTLADVQPSVERFLDEADKCAQEECGLSCLLTVFPVMLGIAEAVRGRDHNSVLMTWFVSEMDILMTWLIVPHSVTASESLIGEKLADVRDSLAHQLSLPRDVLLANNSAEAKCASTRYSDKYIISTHELTQAVRETAIRVIQSNLEVNFDSDPRGIDRGVANRRAIVLGPLPSSGSAMDGSFTPTASSTSSEWD